MIPCGSWLSLAKPFPLPLLCFTFSFPAVSLSNEKKTTHRRPDCWIVSINTYGHICLCSRNSPDSTGTSCGSRSSPPACRPSCRWSWKNNTVRQDALTPHWQEQEAIPNRKWVTSLLLPVARASVGGPRVRAGLLCHVVVRMRVRLFHRGGEAAAKDNKHTLWHIIDSQGKWKSVILLSHVWWIYSRDGNV